ncbi:MAG: leucine-rich repeat domain-containing protein [Oscillospiraceae bacterium]|nr:leucine-rich repeat domain-containing protein [Oscillospiraceae bacterium]
MSYNGENELFPRLFEFEKTDNGCELKRYLQKDNKDITELEIPAKFRFFNVRGIYTNAFKDAVHLRSVVIPETVVSTGYSVFKGCRMLSDISLPGSLKLINGNMFNGCGSLKRMVVPESVDIIRPNAFSSCRMLEEVVLPESGCILYSGAFRDCPNLRSVVFPGKDNVTLLGSVFENCPLLPAEARMYALIGLNDLDKPFVYNTDFDWSTALREDVFTLAVKHDSFLNIGKDALFRQIIDNDLIELLPLAKDILDDRLVETLADYSADRGKTEITAWLLNLKNGCANVSIEQLINERFEL